MALSSLNEVITSLRPPIPFNKGPINPNTSMATQWAQAGAVPARSYNATLNGAIFTGDKKTSGALYRVNPASLNAYLASLQMTSWTGSGSNVQPSMVFLADRIWDCRPSHTVNTLQSITSPTWPARDVNGSTNGDGVLLALEIATSVTSGLSDLTVTYTNQAGTGSRTASMGFNAITGAATAGAMIMLGLQGNDTGVRSVQSVQFTSAATGGAVNLIAFRLIAAIDFRGLSRTMNALQLCLPRIYDDSHLYFFSYGPSTSNAVTGTLTEALG